jgi:hypothetical protein
MGQKQTSGHLSARHDKAGGSGLSSRTLARSALFALRRSRRRGYAPQRRTQRVFDPRQTLECPLSEML